MHHAPFFDVKSTSGAILRDINITLPDGGAVFYNGEKLNTDGKINGKGIFGIIFQVQTVFMDIILIDTFPNTWFSYI